MKKFFSKILAVARPVAGAIAPPPVSSIINAIDIAIDDKSDPQNLDALRFLAEYADEQAILIDDLRARISRLEQALSRSSQP